MKVTFYSNFLNHHQLTFCKEMYKRLGCAFKFVATEPVPQERLTMGYHDMSTQYPFALNTYSSNESYEQALKLGYESDVVIIGSAPNKFIKERLKSNRITFYYMERILKKGRHKMLNPKTLSNLLLNHSRYRNKNLYMLCASAYTASDFNMVGAYKNKAYKWGYFPEHKIYNINTLMKTKEDNIVPKLLWVGRYLDWKHPDDVIKLAIMLKENNYEFCLDIIGTGTMEGKLENLIENNNLNYEVKLLGSMKPEEVRVHMEKANIFLFTSDFNEGWGAVLNESMNSGCAVVASHAIGSVPFLIENKFNGLVYENGNINDFYESVKKLLNNRKECSRIGINAYNTIKNTWNAEEAAKRLIKLSEALMNGNQLNIERGPCSRAELIKNDWISQEHN